METYPKMTQMIELLDKNIKTAIKTMFHMLENLQERLNISRGMEDIKKTQIKLLEINYSMFEIKNTPDGVNRRLGTTEEKVSELEDLAIRFI